MKDTDQGCSILLTGEQIFRHMTGTLTVDRTRSFSIACAAVCQLQEGLAVRNSQGMGFRPAACASGRWLPGLQQKAPMFQAPEQVLCSLEPQPRPCRSHVPYRPKWKRPVHSKARKVSNLPIRWLTL